MVVDLHMKYCNAVPDPGFPVESLNVHYKNICITKLLDLVTFLVWLAVLANFLWRRFFCLLDPGPPYGSGSNISPILWTHVDPDPTFLPFCGTMWIRIQSSDEKYLYIDWATKHYLLFLFWWAENHCFLHFSNGIIRRTTEQYIWDRQRRRITAEEKAMVVHVAWAAELIQFFAALAIVHQTDVAHIL